MKSKTILTAILILAALIGLASWGYLKSSKPSAAVTSDGVSAALAASEKFYNFGTISMRNGKVAYRFQVSNPTSADIALREVSTSCMCTTAYIVDGENRIGPFGMPGHGGGMIQTDYVVKAGATIGVEAVFDPAAHGPAGVGAIDRLITLTQADGSRLNLEIKANVTP